MIAKTKQQDRLQAKSSCFLFPVSSVECSASRAINKVNIDFDIMKLWTYMTHPCIQDEVLGCFFFSFSHAPLYRMQLRDFCLTSAEITERSFTNFSRNWIKQVLSVNFVLNRTSFPLTWRLMAYYLLIFNNQGNESISIKRDRKIIYDSSLSLLPLNSIC